MGDLQAGRWLLLIHQIPPKPSYLRVKTWRRLQRLGAVPIKNSVYVLPQSDDGREDLEWVRREIVEGGGDALICEARLVDGLTDEQVEAQFNDARSADFVKIAEEARQLLEPLGESAGEERNPTSAEIQRLVRRYAEIVAIDFFRTPARGAAESFLARLERPAAAAGADPKERPMEQLAEYQGRTWVTRRGIKVDRMASAWLIRRFIDKDARLAFVPPTDYNPNPGDIRFDMFEAEFTHEGDHCTFEVLMDRFGIDDAALRAVAEIVHDIDLKDTKYGRADTAGVQRLIAGIVANHAEDGDRLARGDALFEDLYQSFRKSPK